jgi:hypothetical protein
LRFASSTPEAFRADHFQTRQQKSGCLKQKGRDDRKNNVGSTLSGAKLNDSDNEHAFSGRLSYRKLVSTLEIAEHLICTGDFG